MTKPNINNLYRKARNNGFILKKAPTHNDPILNHGYQILDGLTGSVVVGHFFELTPEDVNEWLNKNNE